MSDPIKASDHVTITRPSGTGLASFDEITILQSQMVFWKNQDNQPHWPTFPPNTGGAPSPVLAKQVGPNATSGSVQPALSLSQFYTSKGSSELTQGVGFPLQYTCSLHKGELGVIQIYGDFFVPTNQLEATSGQTISINLTTGGVPTFTFTFSTPPPGLTVINDPNQGPVLTGTVRSAGIYNFSLRCVDAAGNNITETYFVTIS